MTLGRYPDSEPVDESKLTQSDYIELMKQVGESEQRTLRDSVRLVAQVREFKNNIRTLHNPTNKNLNQLGKELQAILDKEHRKESPVVERTSEGLFRVFFLNEDKKVSRSDLYIEINNERVRIPFAHPPLASSTSSREKDVLYQIGTKAVFNGYPISYFKDDAGKDMISIPKPKSKIGKHDVELSIGLLQLLCWSPSKPNLIDPPLVGRKISDGDVARYDSLLVNTIGKDATLFGSAKGVLFSYDIGEGTQLSRDEDDLTRHLNEYTQKAIQSTLPAEDEVLSQIKDEEAVVEPIQADAPVVVTSESYSDAAAQRAVDEPIQADVPEAVDEPEVPMSKPKKSKSKGGAMSSEQPMVARRRSKIGCEQPSQPPTIRQGSGLRVDFDRLKRDGELHVVNEKNKSVFRRMRTTKGLLRLVLGIIDLDDYPDDYTKKANGHGREKDFTSKDLEAYKQYLKTVERYTKNGGKHMTVQAPPVIVTDVKSLFDKLEVLLGEMQAGNRSQVNSNTASAIIDELLKQQAISQKEHRALLKLVF